MARTRSGGEKGGKETKKTPEHSTPKEGMTKHQKKKSMKSDSKGKKEETPVEAKNSMQPRINIITLGTTDLAKATAFYEEGLKFPRMHHPGDISFFTLNGTWLALYPHDELTKDVGLLSSSKHESSFRGVTLAHLVESEELELVRAAGRNIIKAAQKAEWGRFSGYFADLDGHVWEVAFNPFFWAGPK
jgi:catechol 2,3-dioxygenase-like lactoylglutathione lyase family enzyme